MGKMTVDAATAATFVVAASTLALAFVTWRQLRHARDQVGLIRDQVRLASDQLKVAARQVGLARHQMGFTRDAFMLSTRPLLADAPEEGGPTECVQFGAPGRHQVNVSKHGFFFEKSYEGTLLCSVPFRNIGAGVAVILDVSVTPTPLGEVFYTRKFVPDGAFVRVNICAHNDPSMADPLMEACKEGGGGFAVTITYSDADGRQKLITRANLQEYATSPMSVRQVAVLREGETEPFAVSGEL